MRYITVLVSYRAWRDWWRQGDQFLECIDCHSFDGKVVNELDLVLAREGVH